MVIDVLHVDSKIVLEWSLWRIGFSLGFLFHDCGSFQRKDIPQLRDVRPDELTYDGKQ